VRFVLGAAAILVAGMPFTPPLLAISPTGDLGKLSYSVEWRLIHAGDVTIEPTESQAVVRIVSAGLVSTLFKVDNTYSAHFSPSFCTTDTLLDSKEGKRHHQTTVTYQQNPNRVIFLERDLVKNEVLKSTQTETPPCVRDALGGLLALRLVSLEPGQSVQSPLTDGRKAAQVRVEAQAREEITTPAGKFKAIRYEANLLNGVVYTRKGRVFIWVTDDARRTPVQIVLRLAFPIGTVTLQLEKEDSK
jgi:hypothetical protein